MSTVLVIVGIVALIAVVAWFLLNRQHPENASGHSTAERRGSAQFFGDVNDRPAGPGAEADGVAGPGQPVPGPSSTPRDERPPEH